MKMRNKMSRFTYSVNEAVFDSTATSMLILFDDLTHLNGTGASGNLETFYLTYSGKIKGWIDWKVPIMWQAQPTHVSNAQYSAP